MCKVPTPEGWTMNPEQISAIIDYAKRRKPAPAGTYTKAILKKCIKEGYIIQTGDMYKATEKAKEYLSAALKSGEEETARRKEAAKVAPPNSEETPKKEGAKGRTKAAEDLRQIWPIKQKQEPKFQAGAQRADHWKMIKPGMTVQEFLNQGGIKVSLLVFEQRGLIRIGGPIYMGDVSIEKIS